MQQQSQFPASPPVPADILKFPVLPERSPSGRLQTDIEVPLDRKVDLFRVLASGEVEQRRNRELSDSKKVVVAAERSEVLNRVANVAIAVLALVILSPFLLLIALAIKLTSRGPVVYVQQRVGMDRRRREITAVFDRRRGDVGGQAFDIYKFRSMRVDAEQASGAVWATQDDPRVTPIGRFMRKTRIDEIPQLINVIIGDMNIVGPRPERPSIFAELRENISDYPLRQQARPGITGWAQINRAYDASMDDVRHKVELDLEYLRRQSIGEDIKIMMRTLPVMLFRRGSC